jgi:hypothetical protein
MTNHKRVGLAAIVIMAVGLVATPATARTQKAKSCKAYHFQTLPDYTSVTVTYCHGNVMAIFEHGIRTKTQRIEVANGDGWDTLQRPKYNKKTRRWELRGTSALPMGNVGQEKLCLFEDKTRIRFMHCTGRRAPSGAGEVKTCR